MTNVFVHPATSSERKARVASLAGMPSMVVRMRRSLAGGVRWLEDAVYTPADRRDKQVDDALAGSSRVSEEPALAPLRAPSRLRPARAEPVRGENAVVEGIP